jgi:hypothetical protein
MDTRKLTLIALLSGVYAVISYVPGFPMFGVPGSRIDLTRSLEMCYGLILGPIYGPLTSFTGALVGKILTGGGVGLFFTPLAIVSSFVAASISRERVFNVKGWVLGSLASLVLIAGWYLTPAGRSVPFYPVIHVFALALILVLRGRVRGLVYSEERRKQLFGSCVVSFSSTMPGHMLGNLIFIVLFDPEPFFFMSILPVTLVERLIITAISTVFIVSLIKTLKTFYPELIYN